MISIYTTVKSVVIIYQKWNMAAQLDTLFVGFYLHSLCSSEVIQQLWTKSILNWSGAAAWISLPAFVTCWSGTKANMPSSFCIRFAQIRPLNIPITFLSLKSDDKLLDKSEKSTRTISMRKTRQKQNENKLNSISWDLKPVYDLIAGKTLLRVRRKTFHHVKMPIVYIY